MYNKKSKFAVGDIVSVDPFCCWRGSWLTEPEDITERVVEKSSANCITAFGSAESNAKIVDVITRIEPTACGNLQSFYYELDKYAGKYVFEDCLDKESNQSYNDFFKPNAFDTFEVGRYVMLSVNGSVKCGLQGNTAGPFDISEDFMFFVSGAWVHKDYTEYELTPYCQMTGHYYYSRILVKAESDSAFQIICPKYGFVMYTAEQPVCAAIGNPRTKTIHCPASAFYSEIKWSFQPCDSDVAWSEIRFY